MMEQWMTVNEAMAELNVSRQHLYKLAKQFEWRTDKIGHTRLYHREDVEDTPGADERKRIGYETRGSGEHQGSTRVEGEDNHDPLPDLQN